MTNEQMNIAIAETCGWKNYGFGWSHPSLPPQANIYGRKLPDYCNDLNAMHEAEPTIKSGSQWLLYVKHLREVTGEPIGCDLFVCALVSATARQRAEAFLRTIGKWEEAE